ncbi:N-acetylglucosamine-6-phosphate deacetylase [Neptunicella marina]|nr:N-acetylglucosamine-6-phosphate deacetylase [Neptunicella marina]
MQAITNATVFTGEKLLECTSVVFDHSGIIQVIPDADLPVDIPKITDFAGDYLVPGFIDLQVNGGGGVMFNSSPTRATIQTMVKAHNQFGTTGLFPTLITDNKDKMRLAISAVDEAIAAGDSGVLGIHLEGPFLNPLKKGAHDASKFSQIDDEAIELLCSLKHGKTIVTLAPELTDAQTITKLTERGVIVCAGHSNATYEQMVEAIMAGAQGFTHLFNAMSPFEGRAPGMVGAALLDKSSWFGIIADGHHVHPASLKLAVQAKQTGGAILVTDAMSTVGATDNSFELNNEIIYAKNGRCVNAAGSLAGSDLDMFSAIKNSMQFADISWQEAVRMASLYPAKACGMDKTCGVIQAGAKASFNRLSANFELRNSWINGAL